jgi:putative ABC transport system permease protein
MPLDLPRLNQISVDWRVLAFSVFTVALCTVIVGLTPALQSLRSETASILNSGMRGGLGAGDYGTGKTLRAFVVVEMTLAVVLMSGAGLLARSLWKVMIVDPGFNPQRLLTADLSLAAEQHLSAQQTLSFYGRLLDDVRNFPAVTSAGLTTNLPIGGTTWGTRFSVEGRPAAASDFLASDQRIVSPGYFETMEIPLVSGRLFADHDTPDTAPVAIVNTAFARRYFPGENPLGQRVKWGRPEDRDLPWWFTIVGVVGDVRHRNLETSTSPELYR